MPVHIAVALVMIIDLRKMFSTNLVWENEKCNGRNEHTLKITHPRFFCQDARYKDVIKPNKARNSLIDTKKMVKTDFNFLNVH